MYARNKTGSPIVGTLERIEGCAKTVGDSFKRPEDGPLEFEHEGWTDVHWDTARTQSNEHGTVFVDETGDAISEQEIELVSTKPEE